MVNLKQLSRLRQSFGNLALISLALLILSTTILVIVRNAVESIIVQRVASDTPLLKNRWPQFKKSVEQLHTPIQEMLAQSKNLEVTDQIKQLMQEITSQHTFQLAGTYGQGSIVAHIEIVLFERDVVRPLEWYWAPPVDTSLKATELQTRITLQQLEQSQLVTSKGLVSELALPESVSNERRARVFFYLHTEWKHYEDWLKFLVRLCQFLAFSTVFLIAAWAYRSTKKITAIFLVFIMSFLGLAIYSSLMLKALSVRTVLTMLITIQFGASANRASDFASLGLVAGAAYSLLILGLLNLPFRYTCTNCKRSVKDDYLFCPFCNFALKRNCGRCSNPVDVRWNYCPSCSEEI
jgi:RNA polymerase subunit RPABC4/transcription elongation factor Spt4